MNNERHSRKNTMTKRTVPVALATLALAACTSVGQVGVMTRPSADPGALIREARGFNELGPAKGTSCRYFLLAIVPWGDSSPSTAMEKALQSTGGDALLNVTVYTSLYGFIPYFNVFSYTCTSVEGTAISFAPPPSEPAATPTDSPPTQ
jgi:hypothetical protein